MRDSSIKKERGSPMTHRDWDFYPSAFLLPTNSIYWANKTLLDIGSGIKYGNPSITFPGAKVYALDPEFGEGGRIIHNTAHEIKLGIVQNIPYDNNLFDHVISSHAIPQHIYPIDMPIAVFEMLRVVKPSGDVRLTPCVPRDMNDISDLLIKVGFVVDFSQRGSDGQMVIIKAGPTLQDPKKKDEALIKIRKSISFK